MEVIVRQFPTGPQTAELVLVLRSESENESQKLDLIGNCGPGDVKVEGVIKLSDDLTHHYVELKAVAISKSDGPSPVTEGEADFRRRFGHASLCNCIGRMNGRYLVTRKKCDCFASADCLTAGVHMETK